MDVSGYSGEEGRQKLIKLLTLVKFVKVEGFEKPLSLADIHAIFLEAVAGSEDARAKLEKVREAPLPQGIRERLVFADRVAALGKAEQARVEEAAVADEGIVANMAPDRTYELSEIRSEDHKKYLELVEKVSRLVYGHFGGRRVSVGLTQTRKLG